jgi:hypothetical protein
MADTVTYAIEAPNGQTYKIDGPAGATQEQVQAEVLKQHPDAIKPPSKEQMRGNIITSDVPTVVGERPNPPAVVEPKRGMMDYLKALGEVPATIGSGLVAQTVGPAYGVYKGITSPNYGTQAGVEEGRQAGGELAQKLQYEPTSPVTQDIMQGIGGAMEAAKVPVTPTGIGEIPSMAKALRNTMPYVQEAARPVLNQVTKTVEPVAAKLASALKSEPRIDLKGIAKTAPSAEDLSLKTGELFDVAKQNGIEINPKDFSANMKQIGKSLEDIGYDYELHPDVAKVLKRLQDPTITKDFNKIKALRTMIGDLQNADTPLKRNIATTLKDEFDTYLANIPETSLLGGSKEGIKAWKDAMGSFSQLKKSEVFTDMLANADLDKSKFTQSGVENSLAMQLRNLAKNKAKMRLFTVEEQDAIRQAAKGGSLQNALRLFGRFTPTGPVSGIFAGGMMLHNPAVGIPFELGATAARATATNMRKNDVSRLAAMMRANAPIAKETTNE